MRTIALALVVSVLSVVSVACTKEAPTTPSSPPTATRTTHGAADAVPGSHEDWCGEHAVPESLCTRCNPSLTAAFKATGDWCEAHGLPESQCLACNPDLKIERPQKAER